MEIGFLRDQTFETPLVVGWHDGPVAVCRFLTVRQLIEFRRAVSEASRLDDEAAAFEGLLSAAKMQVVDVRGHGVTLENMDDHLTPGELIQLLQWLPERQSVEATTLKKSDAPSPSSTDNCAGHAGTVDATSAASN